MTTPTNSPVRSATSPELVKFRADGQFSKIGIAIQHPPTVYTMRVNEVWTGTGGRSQLTYDGGSGTLANVLEGMTVFIGSAAGLFDRVITRVRKTPSATILYIGETSATISDNDYITIVNSFSIWNRDITNNGGVVSMDYDILFGDLTRGGIIPRLGPVAAVINQTTGTITFVPPNPSLSAGYDGATVSSLVFAAPGASTTSNMTSATTASWTYPLTADGEYRWSCAITDSLGRVTTAYRWVFVNPSEIPFSLGSCGASFDDGDWSFEITNYADVSAIHPRALVTLYAKDYYAGVEGSIGKLAGYENVIATGFIDGESIEQNSETGTVSFTVHSAAYWMGRIRTFPLELMDTSAPETGWNTLLSMTVDYALSRLIYWTSTAPLVMDIFLTGDLQRVKVLSQSGPTLIDQIRAIAQTVFAVPLVNSYGQMFIQVDPQILDSTDRAGLTVVMDITSADYAAPLNILIRDHEVTSIVELDALMNYDGATDVPLYARAPGYMPMTFGDISTHSNYVIEDQAECTRIAGCLLAIENNFYEPLELSMPANIRLFDIAPSMYATITTSAASNPRGRALTAKSLIPRRIDYAFENGALTANITFEVATTPTDGVDYFPPTVQDNNLDDGLDSTFGVDFPIDTSLFTETVPPDIDTPCARDIANSFSLNFSPRKLVGSTSVLISHAYFPCTIRGSGVSVLTSRIYLALKFDGDAATHVTMYAMDGDSRVLTASAGISSQGTSTFDFTPISDVAVTGFELELDAGAGATITRYEAGRAIESGDMNVATTLCVVGQYYSIEAYTGHWTATFPAPIVGLSFYNTKFTSTNFTYLGGAGRDGLGDFHLQTDKLFVERSNYNEAFDANTQEFEFVGNYARIYFISTVPAQQATLIGSDTLTLGIAYSNMRWTLREAEAIGRQVTIGGGIIANVCGT